MWIKIENEKKEIEEIVKYDFLPILRCGEEEWYVAENSKQAGIKAREAQVEFMESDFQEFKTIVGMSNLDAWEQGQLAGPGKIKVRSLEEWLDIWLSLPHEKWGAWDTTERKITEFSKDLPEALGFSPTVAYRYN